MAAVVGSAGRLAPFEREWREMLASFGVKRLHAVNVRGGRAEFRNWPPEKRLDIARSAERIRASHTDFGVVSFMFYSDYFVAYDWPLSRAVPASHKEVPYQIAFRHCLVSGIDVILSSDVYMPGTKLAVVAEHSGKYGSLKPVFFDIRRKLENNGCHLLTDIHSGRKDDYYGLQAADTLAYSTKHQEETGNMVIESHPISSVLGSEPNATGVIRCPITCSVLEDQKNLILALFARRQSSRASRAGPVSARSGL